MVQRAAEAYERVPKVSDATIPETTLHYGLSMEHREAEVEASGELYEAISEVLTGRDALGSLASGHGRYSATGLAGLIAEFADSPAPGRYHALAFGGNEAESQTASIGRYVHTQLLSSAQKSALSMHPSDLVCKDCQALMLNAVLEGRTIYFHLDDISNLDAIVAGTAGGSGVTTNELLFLRANWNKVLGPYSYYDTATSAVKSGSGRFDSHSVKFFLRGDEVPSPF